MAKNEEISITLTRISLSSVQRKALAEAVIGAVTANLARDSKKDLLLRRPSISAGNIKINIQRVEGGSN